MLKKIGSSLGSGKITPDPTAEKFPDPTVTRAEPITLL
jgi:hypothetical protein